MKKKKLKKVIKKKLNDYKKSFIDYQYGIKNIRKEVKKADSKERIRFILIFTGMAELYLEVFGFNQFEDDCITIRKIIDKEHERILLACDNINNETVTYVTEANGNGEIIIDPENDTEYDEDCNTECNDGYDNTVFQEEEGIDNPLVVEFDEVEVDPEAADPEAAEIIVSFDEQSDEESDEELDNESDEQYIKIPKTKDISAEDWDFIIKNMAEEISEIYKSRLILLSDV